jgi:hypothetical protein
MDAIAIPNSPRLRCVVHPGVAPTPDMLCDDEGDETGAMPRSGEGPLGPIVPRLVNSRTRVPARLT